MKTKILVIGLVLVLSTLIVSGCTPTTAEPTRVPVPTDTPMEAPTDTPTEVATEVSEWVLAARDAALAYVGEQYGEEAPALGLIWTGGSSLPENPPPGWSEYQFTPEDGTGDWVITIGHAVLPPEQTVYQIAVTNQATGFQWEGEVDARGEVMETLAPTVDDFQPLVTAACSDLADAIAQTLGVEVTTAEAPFDDYVGRKTVMGCQAMATGTGLDLDMDVFLTLSEMLQARGWQEDLAYSAGGPLGLSAGFRQEDELCLLSVGWEPSEDADCPTDQPIDVCELEPEQQLYTLVLNYAQDTAPVAPTGEPVACWYGRVESTPADAAIEDYLVLLPKEARRAVDVLGADEAVEAEIEALRDSGTYAHFWGTLNCDVPGWGGCQLIVNRLRSEGPEGPFFDPDPVEGWTGNVFSTPDDAQFDDYFVRSGGVPMRYGIESADATIAAQLDSLRDAAAIVRVWGQVTCPAIDFQGSHIQVDRIEVVLEASRDGYEGWKPYLNEKFGYALWYPGECTVMGTNLDESVTFSGPLVANEHWPVLTVSHYDSEFYHPPAGTDVSQWVADFGMSYDEMDTGVQIAGLPAARLTQKAGPGWYGSDEYYFIRGDQLFRISLLHAGGQEDRELYDKFLQSLTFP